MVQIKSFDLVIVVNQTTLEPFIGKVGTIVVSNIIKLPFVEPFRWVLDSIPIEYNSRNWLMDIEIEDWFRVIDLDTNRMVVDKKEP